MMYDRVIVGSCAAEIRELDFGRVPRDIDVIATHDGYRHTIKEITESGVFIKYYPLSGDKMIIVNPEGNLMEVEIAWPGTTGAEFIELVKTDPRSVKDEVWVPCLEALYALKMSHRFLKDSPHFEKTRNDIKIFRQHVSAEIDPHYAEWFKQREKATYAYGHPNLDQKSSEFFSGDGVKYIWEHDTIHEAMALFHKPAYKYFQEGEVKVSKEKWDLLSPHIKLASVVEESFVLALERSQVPFDFKPNPTQSFKKALEKVCTSITSGWWREYAWENYDEALTLYHALEEEKPYVQIFKDAVASGVIKPGKDHVKVDA